MSELERCAMKYRFPRKRESKSASRRSNRVAGANVDRDVGQS